MTKNRLPGGLGRVALSVIFAGIFFIGWLVFAILTFRSGFGGKAAFGSLIVRSIITSLIWILAPILTGLGFAVGSKIFELLSATGKTSLWKNYMWCFIGCAIGFGIVWPFGPMLIVFGMFVTGTISVVLHEVVRIRKEARNNKA